MSENNIIKVPYGQADITGGFWEQRQKINREVTVGAIYDRFKETGRIDAFRMDWKEGQPNKPHFFWDSDVAKWIESAAYIIAKSNDAELENKIDYIIDEIEKGQGADGYFNIYFNVVEPEKRFTDRSAHELYCAGHLFEASVAYYQATGKDKFLKLMCEYADYIEKVFKVENSAAFETCGHEEIELALVRLYNATGEKRYLELSKYFIDKRGTNPNEVSIYDGREYAQDHLPVRKQSTAEGHAVRAMYLYCAMADIAREYNDKALYDACERVWENTTNRRMYITGALGSTYLGERFTYDYDLPNMSAYAETCASIGLIMFAHRMLLINPDSKYADISEKALYNGVLSGISLSGDSFFYENPLEMQPDVIDYYANLKNCPHLPIYERKKVFDCSCCPPNISRLIADIGSYIYTQSEDMVFIHHYMENTATLNFSGQQVVIEQQTSYPWQGDIKIYLKPQEAIALTVAVRIPGWCNEATVKVNGISVAYEDMIKNGYLYIKRIWNNNDVIEIELSMQVVEMEGRPELREDCGRIALQRGPIVYCIEEADNGKNLNDIVLSSNPRYKTEFRPDILNGVTVVTASAYRRNNWGNTLYRPYLNSFKEVEVIAVPYYSWANRGRGEMLIWIRKQICQ